MPPCPERKTSLPAQPDEPHHACHLSASVPWSRARHAATPPPPPHALSLSLHGFLTHERVRVGCLWAVRSTRRVLASARSARSSRRRRSTRGPPDLAALRLGFDLLGLLGFGGRHSTGGTRRRAVRDRCCIGIGTEGNEAFIHLRVAHGRRKAATHRHTQPTQEGGGS